MSKVSLKIVVAGRTYPLTVQESEVGKVELAASEINKAIQQLQENFAVRDMQDLLAMTALQLSTKTGNASKGSSVDFTETTEALKSLANNLDALS